jgi:hypothetical protein
LKRYSIIAAIAAIALAVPVIAKATGSSLAQAANKATAAASTVLNIGPGVKKPLLSATIKTSKTEDLVLQLSMECSILTNVVVKGSSDKGASTLLQASASVRAWVEVDGHIVPVDASSSPPQTPALQALGTEKDKATFCDRVHARNITDKEDLLDGHDLETDYQRTKSANAFNWLRLNVGSGTHLIKVYGDFTVLPATECGVQQPPLPLVKKTLSTDCALAWVGNRTLIIEPTKTANNASF